MIRPAGITVKSCVRISSDLIIKEGQAQAQTPVQVMRGGAAFDHLDHFLGLVAGQRPALVDQLAEHAIAFFLVFAVNDKIRR